MKTKDYILVENVLTPALYREMHEVCHFKEYDLEDIKIALDHDLYDVVVYDGDRAVAIARVVGDGRIVFFLKDVIVHPDYQHQGCGELIMKAFFNYLSKHACKGAYVGLMATPGVEKFYAKYGFIERPTEGLGSGMVLFYE
ncbi:GNAT family N-acetyltransferase [Erysipelothrix tonsillarum]|uniref:GNAT family N-acetyltransferase n=1 Tax=Erysipelothrix tonsillarum TaxID=38402 RepID=UPI00037E70D9|nr:GNAT family N-acetyltransferase [Erysipelothrix tonsillarum]